MHKGRQYELEPLARVYSCQASYPQWWAKSYQLSMGFWQGSYAGQMTSISEQTVYADIDRDLGFFEHRATYPNSGTKVIEIVLSCGWNMDHTNIIIDAQVYADGVPQMAAPTAATFFNNWKQGSKAGFLPPLLPGAVIGWAGNLSYIAVPW